MPASRNDPIAIDLGTPWNDAATSAAFVYSKKTTSSVARSGRRKRTIPTLSAATRAAAGRGCSTARIAALVAAVMSTMNSASGSRRDPPASALASLATCAIRLLLSA